MKTEYEVKILDIDPVLVERKLLALGATALGTKQQRRYVYNLPGEKRWLRLRDESTRVTLALKEIEDETVAGTKELEVTVDSFERTAELLARLGFTPWMYQENRRTSFVLGAVEFEIDEWPKIPPYLEIEAASKAEVERAVKLLGFAMEQTISVNTIAVYEKYGFEFSSFKELRF